MTKKGEVSEFQRLLNTAIKASGGRKKDFADAIGLTPSGLSRLTAASASVYYCLRIAQVAGQVNPSRLLRAAGQDDTADLIESLYGEPAGLRGRPRYTATEDRIIGALRKLPASTARHFRVLILIAGDAEDQLIAARALRKNTKVLRPRRAPRRRVASPRLIQSA